MEAIWPSETWVDSQRTTPCYIRAFYLLSHWFLILWPWRLGRYDPPIRRFTFNVLHGVISLLATRFHTGFLFFNPEDGGDMTLQNMGWLSTDYMPLYLRRQTFSSSPLWEPHVFVKAIRSHLTRVQESPVQPLEHSELRKGYRILRCSFQCEAPFETKYVDCWNEENNVLDTELIK
jgi:hypothetical protein